jgi:hypothetical protein
MVDGFRETRAKVTRLEYASHLIPEFSLHIPEMK